MKRNIKKQRLSKKLLALDFAKLLRESIVKNYGFGTMDAFAIGYLCGKYNLSSLYNNNNNVIAACEDYDKTDDLALLDTVGETLIDLGVIINDGRL